VSYAALPDPRRRLVVANPEHATIRLDPRPSAPPSDECARECGVEEINRHGIVQHATHSGRSHRPTIGAAILVEPSGHVGLAVAKTAERHTEPDLSPLV
jgi:hypothetical protein